MSQQYKVLAPCKGVGKILQSGEVITIADIPLDKEIAYEREGFIEKYDANVKPTVKDLSEKHIVEALEAISVAIPEKYTRKQIEKLYTDNKAKIDALAKQPA